MSIGSSKGATGDLTQHTLRLMGYLLLAIFLMALDHRAQYLKRFHAVVDELTQPLYLLIDAPIHGASQISAWFAGTRELIDTQQRMSDALLKQRVDALRLEALRQENKSLRDLLGLSQSVQTEYLSARVLQVDLNPFSHRLVIDRGRVDGVVPGLAVMDQQGLIGQIDGVSATSSTVILITDPDHALPVRVLRTGLVTLAYGGGLSSDLSLPDLPMNVELQPGDGLITSGLGGVFPSGLPVAVINAIDRPTGERFARATATSLGAHDRAPFVLILKTPKTDDEPDVSDEASEAPMNVEDPGNG